jgi:signal transduction histidine kinase
MADHISALIQAQQRFIADASHEIKSPLARIGVAAALARRFTSPDGEEQFDRLERDIDTASSLVRELQVLSSLQGAGTLSPLAKMDIVDLLAAAIDNVAFERGERPHGIRLTAPSEPVIMLGDPALLQRAVENVLRNALFYTGEGTDVEMILARRSDGVHIEVRDHGPGVSMDALSHLFDPFYRVDASRTRNTGGVGIGLAIFKRAIVLHGGVATAENAVPSGLRICIDLPLVEAG